LLAYFGRELGVIELVGHHVLLILKGTAGLDSIVGKGDYFGDYALVVLVLMEYFQLVEVFVLGRDPLILTWYSCSMV
jgi:hypothetical protein